MKKIIRQIGSFVAQSALAYAVNEACKATLPKIKEAFERNSKKSKEDSEERQTKRDLATLVRNTKKKHERRIKEKKENSSTEPSDS